MGRVWYSIVTERKQPEIRSKKLQEKPLSKGSHTKTGREQIDILHRFKLLHEKVPHDPNGKFPILKSCLKRKSKAEFLKLKTLVFTQGNRPKDFLTDRFDSRSEEQTGTIKKDFFKKSTKRS